MRVQVWLDDGEEVPSVVPVWPTADWHEREQYDLMGIVFAGHPNLRRLILPSDWAGHPCARTTRSAASRSSSRTPYEHRRAPARPGRPALHARADPAGAPSKVDLPPGEDLITVNFGPNHPSTHGVLRLIVTLDGEVVVGLDADIGYVHTGFERNLEQKTCWKCIPSAPRIDYVAFFANELAYVGAVEKLIGIGVPERAQWIRTLFAELNRIHSQPGLPGHVGVEIGAMAVFFYCLGSATGAGTVHDDDGLMHGRAQPGHGQGSPRGYTPSAASSVP